MASAYGKWKSLYRAVLSQPLRHRIYLMTPPPLRRLRAKIISQLEKGAKHNEIYDSEYYNKHVEPEMVISAKVIAASIIEQFSPRTVVDVGCGTGALLAALSAEGIPCSGLEYADAAIEICVKRGLNVRKFDLESPIAPDESASLVTSTEVAEHLPATIADHYVDVLTRIADTVLITAAVPSGGLGTDHVNEQPNEYWIEKFAARGYSFDASTSNRLRDEWRLRGASGIYYSTAMVFRHATKYSMTSIAGSL